MRLLFDLLQKVGRDKEAMVMGCMLLEQIKGGGGGGSTQDLHQKTQGDFLGGEDEGQNGILAKVEEEAEGCVFDCGGLGEEEEEQGMVSMESSVESSRGATSEEEEEDEGDVSSGCCQEEGEDLEREDEGDGVSNETPILGTPKLVGRDGGGLQKRRIIKLAPLSGGGDSPGIQSINSKTLSSQTPTEPALGSGGEVLQSKDDAGNAGLGEVGVANVEELLSVDVVDWDAVFAQVKEHVCECASGCLVSTLLSLFLCPQS